VEGKSPSRGGQAPHYPSTAENLIAKG